MKKYGETSTDRWARDMTRSREIVAEIMRFGVSQTQLTQIINLLALELEDRDVMLAFTNAYKDLQEDTLELEESTTKIILDS